MIQLELAMTTRRCRQLRRESQYEKLVQLSEEIHEAWKKGHHSEVHRLRVVLAANGYGIRKRKLYRPPGRRLEEAELTSGLALPGAQGGLAAALVDPDQYFEKYVKEIEEQDDQQLPFTYALEQRAERDVQGVIAYCRRASKRKYTPEWGTCVEALLLALRPGHNLTHRQQGLGYREEQGGETFYNKFKEVMVQIRRTVRTPVDWHRSKAFLQSKNNTAGGIRGQRVIHCFDHAGAAWYSAQLKEHPPNPMYWEHGGWRGRSREEAIIVQNQSQWRLAQAGRSHVLSLYDAANAFGCTKKESLDKLVATWPREQAVHFEDRNRHKMCTVALPEGNYTYQPGEGDLMGFTTAPRQFMENYVGPLKNGICTSHTRTKRTRSSLLATGSKEPWLTSASPLSLTTSLGSILLPRRWWSIRSPSPKRLTKRGHSCRRTCQRRTIS